MAIQDFKISYTFTVNPQEISTPAQGETGAAGTIFFQYPIPGSDSPGASISFLADLASLKGDGAGGTIFIHGPELKKGGSSVMFDAAGITNIKINILKGPLQNILSGLRLNRGSC